MKTAARGNGTAVFVWKGNNEEGKRKYLPSLELEGDGEGSKGGMSFTLLIISAKCDENMIIG